MTTDDNPADNVGGRPVTATDDRDETLTYTLSGADAAMFRVRANGQIEVSDKAMLDYEANSSHTVTLTATDSSGAANNSASIRVTIYVTDLDERPTIRASTGGVIITDGPRSVRIDEEDDTTVGTYIADPEGATLTLSGDDAGDFRLSNGALAFRSAPDYEDPMDANGDNIYMVTVVATEGEMTRDRDVTVDGHQRERAGGGDAVDNAAPGWNGDNREPDRRGRHGEQRQVAVGQVRIHGRALQQHPGSYDGRLHAGRSRR